MIRHILLLIALLSAIPGMAAETTYRSGDRMTIAEGDSVVGDLFYGGQSLKMEGTVGSDIYAAGQEIIVEGNVYDNLFAAGENIYIRGDIGDGVVAAGKMVRISGRVGGDVRAYGGFVEIEDGAEIMGNLFVGTGQFTLQNATIHGSIKGGAGHVNLNGTVGKDIYLETEQITFDPEFSSNGQVTLTLPNMPEESIPNAPDNMEIKVTPQKHFFQKYSFYWFLISALVIGIILLVLFRPLYDNIIAYGKEKFLASSGTGILFLILTPVLAVLAITVLPLAFILAGLYIIILYLSKIFASFLVGHVLFEKLKLSNLNNPYLAFFTGLILLTLLSEVPILGTVLSLLIYIIGCGTFVYYLFKLREKQNHLAA